jgi:hypothetical protein
LFALIQLLLLALAVAAFDVRSGYNQVRAGRVAGSAFHSTGSQSQQRRQLRAFARLPRLFGDEAATAPLDGVNRFRSRGVDGLHGPLKSRPIEIRSCGSGTRLSVGFTTACAATDMAPPSI